MRALYTREKKPAKNINDKIRTGIMAAGPFRPSSIFIP
jgi:hypothetical protein